ncbi:MAG: DUF58 domain-containing protein, partial [Lentisphaeria bacterium]|nr:DUF58 domain-containing protein [Lentisphaeria bacterium]
MKKEAGLTDTAIAMRWCTAWCRRWFTPAALLPLPAMVLVVLYALIAQDSPARYLLLIFLVLLAAAMTAVWFFRPALEIRREIPPRAAAGDEFTISSEVRNRSRWRTCYDVRLDPYLFYPDLEVLDPPVITRLAPGKTQHVSGRYRLKKRGVLRCYRPLAETAFPFGLVKGSCRSGMVQQIVLYPRFHPLQNCPVPAGRVRREMGCEEEIRIGDSPEFLGCRDYRIGDDVRRIDWRGSARRGTPVVREFEDERFRRTALIVDTGFQVALYRHWKWRRFLQFFQLQWFSGKESPSPWEAELALALAAGEALLRAKTAVDALWLGNQIYPLNRTQTPVFHQLCDLLGAAEPADPGIPALEDLPQRLGNTGSAILFLLQDDPERRMLAAALTASGIALEIILISDQ